MEDWIWTNSKIFGNSKQTPEKGREGAAEAMTDEKVKILYMKNLLGITSAEALLNTLWFMNSFHFGLRGCDDHQQVTWGDFQLIIEVDGTEYWVLVQTVQFLKNKAKNEFLSRRMMTAAHHFNEKLYH